MRNSAYYAQKVKKLLAGARASPPAEPVDTVRLLVTAVLEEDAAGKQVSSAQAALQEEFVDFNELRVSPAKDVADCLGCDCPGARAKAETLTRALNAVFERANTLSLEYLAKKPKREVRKLLREQVGLSPYAESVLTLYGFAGHAIPVDNLLVEAMKLEGLINPDSDVPDLQGFLERIIPARDAIACHEALRAYACQVAPRVAEEMARREAQARAEAEVKAKAEAEAKAKAEVKAQARAEAKARQEAARARKKKPPARARGKARAGKPAKGVGAAAAKPAPRKPAP